MDKCKIPDCDSPRYVRGWCRTHYHRWWRHGDPMKLFNHRKGRKHNPSAIKEMTDFEAAQVGRMIDTDGCITHSQRSPRHWNITFTAITLPQLTDDLKALIGAGAIGDCKSGKVWRMGAFLSILDLVRRIEPWSYKAQAALPDLEMILNPHERPPND